MTYFLQTRLSKSLAIFSTALLLTSTAVANAQEQKPNDAETQATFIDGELQSASDIIDALKPKPRYKTRGIRFNNTAPAAEPAPAPRIAMGVNFAYDSDQLSEQAKLQLKPLGEALNSEQLANYSFKLDGHTDATGSETYNLNLSERRALSVGQHLYEAYGVKVERLKLSGMGEAQLYDPKQPAAGINRRVEITTLLN